MSVSAPSGWLVPLASLISPTDSTYLEQRLVSRSYASMMLPNMKHAPLHMSTKLVSISRPLKNLNSSQHSSQASCLQRYFSHFLLRSHFIGSGIHITLFRQHQAFDKHYNHLYDIMKTCTIFSALAAIAAAAPYPAPTGSGYPAPSGQFPASLPTGFSPPPQNGSFPHHPKPYGTGPPQPYGTGPPPPHHSGTGSLPPFPTGTGMVKRQLEGMSGIAAATGLSSGSTGTESGLSGLGSSSSGSGSGLEGLGSGTGAALPSLSIPSSLGSSTGTSSSSSGLEGLGSSTGSSGSSSGLEGLSGSSTDLSGLGKRKPQLEGLTGSSTSSSSSDGLGDLSSLGGSSGAAMPSFSMPASLSSSGSSSGLSGLTGSSGSSDLSGLSGSTGSSDLSGLTGSDGTAAATGVSSLGRRRNNYAQKKYVRGVAAPTGLPIMPSGVAAPSAGLDGPAQSGVAMPTATIGGEVPGVAAPTGRRAEANSNRAVVASTLERINSEKA